MKHYLQKTEFPIEAMELQSSFLLITFFLLLVWLAKNYKQKVKAKLPPGPWKLPLIGNLHQLAAAGSLPHHALRELARKYGPLMHLQLGEISAVVVSSADLAKEIMKTRDLAFMQRPELLCSKIWFYDSTDIGFAPYGDYWRQMRKICTLELLSAKKVRSFSFLREDEIAKLIESIQLSAGSPINLTTRIFYTVSAIVSTAAFGKKSEDEEEEERLALLKIGAELTAGFDLSDLFPTLKPIHLITRTKAKLEKTHKQLDRILEKIVNEHQVKTMKAKEGKGEAGEEDLVDVLLRVQQSGSLDVPITTNNIKAVILDVFGAGTDTSLTAIEWAMSEMMRNPRVREKAQAEIREAFKGKKTISEDDLQELGYFKSVIKETLRLHPPLPLLPRECNEACKIGGYEIAIKTKVIVNAWALGRDPNYWYDAESFIPERFHGTSFDFKGTNFEYLPFGAGKRICPGILFGVANIELPLAKLLYHFDWELPNGMKPENLDMTESLGTAVRRKNNLYLVPTPYNPSLRDNVY